MSDAVDVDPLSQPTLQLRILSGMHAGARASLTADEYTLGTSEDCDFVLSDPGVHARHAHLSRRDDGWLLDWAAGQEGALMFAPVRMEPGKAVTLGPVVVAVDDDQAPWPTLEQLVLVPHAPALEPTLLPPPEEPVEMQFGWRVRVRRVLTRGAVGWGATVAAAGVSAVALVAWPSVGHDHPQRQEEIITSANGASAAQPAAAPDAEVAKKRQIETALAALGLADRVKLERSADRWLVRAVVMTEAESESLTAALSRMSPPPLLRMTTEQDLRDEVADMLLRVGPEYRGSVALRYLGEARFRLEGRMVKAAERDKLLRTMAAALPHVREWENGIIAGEESGDSILAELRSRGPWQVTGNWDNGKFAMAVRLHESDVPRWEQALVSVAAQHSVPLNANVEFVQPIARATPATVHVAAPSVSLPFEVRSVVGGDMPYVLLPNGEKLVRGGSWQGWRLATVTETQVVFDNGGRRAILTR